MITGKRAGVVAGAQPAADFEARDAGQHPVEDDEVGRVFGEPQFRLVAALDAFDDVALGLEIVGEQHRKIRLVLDHEDARAPTQRRCGRLSLRDLVHAPPPAASTSASPGGPRGRSEGIGSPGDEIEDGLGDVGGVIADPLDVLRAEQEMGAEGDVARILHHVGEEVAEHRILERVEIDVALPDFARARSASRCA